jgi:transposase
MADRDGVVASPTLEVPMVDAEGVRQIRELARRGLGAKRIARELGIARNTVRRYLRGGEAAEVQVRPTARALDEVARVDAVRLFEGPAEGNAVVAAQMLRERGVDASVRTVQRAVTERRRELRAAQVATVRFETAPGHQMQIDFGEKRISIAGQLVRVYLFVAVLSFSRRIFVRAFLSERHDDWREGLVGAFQKFGGVPQTVLVDNAGALVVGRDRVTQTVRFHPAFVEFCRDWAVVPRACQPYRARTKGKTESGVKFVKRNAVAGREFISFAALEGHLAAWTEDADGRIHGTTHERPIDRFEREERQTMAPLPARPLIVRQRRLKRRVASDCLVDVDTVRYSVPHRFVRDDVEVLVGDDDVRIFHRGAVVAAHRRSFEPHSRVVDPQHYAGLWRPGRVDTAPVDTAPLAALGRSLADYAAIVEESAS